MKLVLPYPVSANRYWRTIVAKRKADAGPMAKARALTFVSDEAKAYKQEVGWKAKAAGMRMPMRGRSSCAFAWSRRTVCAWTSTTH